MDTNQLSIFIDVMRRGSYAAVARERGVDPATISRSIATLEDTLKLRLFQRTTRRLDPTEAARVYFERVEPLVEEIITGDERGRVAEIRYRVKCIGRHSPTGNVVGYGIGECSTGEDKYAWRRSVCIEEFEATDELLRRVKWGKYQGKTQKTEQVRVNPADMANTVLKMAKKRAQIDMTLTTLGCSDLFAQDLEDLDETLRENFTPEPQGDPELLLKWTSKAAAQTNPEALRALWAEGIKEIKGAKDMAAYNAFKAAVEARGKELKNATPAPAMSDSDADFVAGLDRVAA